MYLFWSPLIHLRRSTVFEKTLRKRVHLSYDFLHIKLKICIIAKHVVWCEPKLRIKGRTLIYNVFQIVTWMGSYPIDTHTTSF